jgi:hypothetical protein
VNLTFCLDRTYFPDAREVVRLEFGEFILHPGSLVHSGADIRSGTRHLMVIFAQSGQVKRRVAVSMTERSDGYA